MTAPALRFVATMSIPRQTYAAVHVVWGVVGTEDIPSRLAWF